MEELLEIWLKDRTFVSLKEIRISLGKDAMDAFLLHHAKMGFRFCRSCNYYVRDNRYDRINELCDSCKNGILEARYDYRKYHHEGYRDRDPSQGHL